MKLLLITSMLVALSATSATAQGYYEPCAREKRDAQRHYYTALRNQGNKGYLDAGEQRVQQQLQARYDACVGASRYRPRYEGRYEGRREYGGCGREKREAERHYYTALRNQGNKGYLDEGEQRVQRQLQARYDACVSRG